MKFIYGTDFHGNTDRFIRFANIANENDVDCVIYGADILPKGSGSLLHIQEEFLNEKLMEYTVYMLGTVNVVFCGLGNDDLAFFDRRFSSIVEKVTGCLPISEKSLLLDDYRFVGLGGLVKDYPFGLKDRCRKDLKNEPGLCPNQSGSYLLTSDKYRYITKEEWIKTLDQRLSLEEELSSMEFNEDEKLILLTHMPPANTGLDVCNSGEKVGSLAILEWIQKYSPEFGLFGHIHESQGEDLLHNSLLINPGDKNCIIVDTDTKMTKYYSLGIL